MRADPEITRRVRVAGIDAGDTDLRGEIFRTFAGYGVIEEILFEVDHAFHSGAIVVQFQRLSSTERLQSDVSAEGRRWSVCYQRPVPHVGEQLLVTSPINFDTTSLRSLLTGNDSVVSIVEKCLQAPNALSSEVADACASESVPVVSMTAPMIKGNPRVVPRRNEEARNVFIQGLSCVEARVIGKHAAVVTFKDVHDANRFLTDHQFTLASKNEIYVTHVGSGADLKQALTEVLLTRHQLKDVSIGAVLRGIVLPQSPLYGSVEGRGSSVNSCEVDVGLIRKGRSVLVRTQTNFVKVLPWAFVEVRLTSLELAADGRSVEGELRNALNVASYSRLNPSISTAVSGVLPSRSGGSVSTVCVGGNTTTSSKELAGRLYRALQERKLTTGPQQQHLSAAGERVDAFPEKLHFFSVVSVCIQRVDECGFHGRTVTPSGTGGSTLQTPGSASREWPVFIPSMFVPREGGGHWRDYAVPGERMTVVLLYASSIGRSKATLRLTASKREVEMSRAAAVNLETVGDEYPGGGQGGRTREQGLPHQPQSEQEPTKVGTRFSGSRVVWLPETPSTREPVYAVLPSPNSPSWLFTHSIFVHAPPASSSLSSPAFDTKLQSFVISEIVLDAHRGHFAFAMEEEAYRRQQEERLIAQEQQESEQEALVKRILAETLSSSVPVTRTQAQCGADASSGSCDVSDCVDNVNVLRKRQRSL
ncbi:hypothetical protein ERJ75_001337200 [Trypanosoma vivax]|uniref:Uncharacterized protein n=1 Tax=Trypanosoma vivax (strain Y486) TaxID=1055687 RepID=G0U657_TRYVY|nr:hypothetical protein TRVL_08211 [Trypanosoma vivax]KAH8608115.1 hypothetical protein ERJ75_001337200 [Trypanosoma vivax]CCC51360.1 conserved hypothetical protein [Trypanosoma vivax Y486]